MRLFLESEAFGERVVLPAAFMFRAVHSAGWGQEELLGHNY